MIPLSLVLIVASAVTLGFGVFSTTSELVWGSLVAGLGAVALVVASVVRRRRQLLPDAAGAVGGTAVLPASPEPGPVPPLPQPRTPGPPAAQAWPWSTTRPTAGSAPGGPVGTAPPRSGWTGAVAPTPGAPAADAEDAAAGALVPDAATDRPPGGPYRDPTASPDLAAAVPPPEPDGEPPIEDVPVRDALRVAQLADEVVVLDGHPRYHLADCPIVAEAGAAAGAFPLAVSVARRGGFTPCAVCAPDRTLLARSQARRDAADG